VLTFLDKEEEMQTSIKKKNMTPTARRARIDLGCIFLRYFSSDLNGTLYKNS